MCKWIILPFFNFVFVVFVSMFAHLEMTRSKRSVSLGYIPVDARTYIHTRTFIGEQYLRTL